jgi:hypothetical protein
MIFCIEMQILDEEPNKNYFSVFWVIPKILNAVWEVIRGFLLPLVLGREYKQFVHDSVQDSWIDNSGLPAHSPENYCQCCLIGIVK